MTHHRAELQRKVVVVFMFYRHYIFAEHFLKRPLNPSSPLAKPEHKMVNLEKHVELSQYRFFYQILRGKFCSPFLTHCSEAASVSAAFVEKRGNFSKL